MDNKDYKSPFSSDGSATKNVLAIMENAHELINQIKTGDTFTQNMSEEQKIEFRKQMEEKGCNSKIAYAEEQLAKLRNMADGGINK